jgi:CheY-like chemotaxis protein
VPQAPTRSGAILIIDDDPVMREASCTALASEGYCVARAANGYEALAYLNDHLAPCLIVLDMMMPGMDGWKFLEALRQRPAWATIPVIITTSMGIASPEWAASLGAAGLLKKPFDEDELMGPVRQLC